MAHLTGEAQPIASATCAIGALGLGWYAFQMHKLRIDPYRGWTEMDMHKMWYMQVAWALSAVAFLGGVPRYVALQTIENYHIVHGPIVAMTSATVLPMMAHATWLNIHPEISWWMNLFPWMTFFMLTSKEWRGQACGAGYAVFFTALFGMYGANVNKLEPLKQAFGLFLASYLFVVLHPDLNMGYSNWSLAGPLQVAGAKMIFEMFKNSGPGDLSGPTEFEIHMPAWLEDLMAEEDTAGAYSGGGGGGGGGGGEAYYY